MIAITENDYQIVKQKFQTRYVKINILDYKMRIVDEISGNLLECSFTNDANSDLRRSCSLSLVVYGKNKAKLTVKSDAEIFLDKYVQPFVGIENQRTGEIQWYNQGIYLINQPSYDFDAQTDTLKFQGIDLMAKMTGARNGQLEGIQTTIKQGENVRQAIIDTIAMAGFTRYIVSECENTDGSIQDVPNDISINAGGTIYNILTALRDILPSYQIYFDIDGIFHYERIPSGRNEQIAVDDNLLNYVLISESTNTEFDKVKNYVEVYGYTHDVEHYPTSVLKGSSSGIIWQLTIPSLTSIYDGAMIGFALTDDTPKDVYLNVNNSGNKRLAPAGKNVIVGGLKANEYYVAYYSSSADRWIFMGHQQAQAIAYDSNPESPFYVDGSVGRIRIVLSGGEYDNIQTDALAQERANYELYLRDKIQDNISLYCIPIPWLDVNMLIQHKVNGDTAATTYIVQNVSWNTTVGGTMTIQARRYYPLYPSI